MGPGRGTPAVYSGKSHTAITWSSPAVATVSPSGDTARQVTHPWCHWYSGYGYKVVWGKSHYYHGDPRAKRYYDDWGDLHYSCSYLNQRYDHGHNQGYNDGDDD